ncbi:MAG: DUF456 domain-containing protein [Armatimonadota bacterium]|nr:DUF456 domain-containing protein [Armatimonadota bacterium]MCX7778157.1 DUF456 domain-containing protein [Armatimonadota bacterium]MDW8024511.1 DUF456 domain-containing protein [Armatimonadota bacterium]
MLVFLKVILALCIIVGLFTIPLGMPGTVIIFGAALIYGIATKFNEMNITTLLILLALCLIAEGGENALGMFFAKRSGASGKSILWSVIGAVAGGLLGAKLSAWLVALAALVMPFIIAALLISAFVTLAFATLGAFVAAFVYELRSGRDRKEALAIAKATVMGRVLGTILKFAAALAMATIIMSAMF